MEMYGVIECLQKTIEELEAENMQLKKQIRNQY